jgi:hypothetical protein
MLRSSLFALLPTKASTMLIRCSTRIPPILVLCRDTAPQTALALYFEEVENLRLQS